MARKTFNIGDRVKFTAKSHDGNRAIYNQTGKVVATDGESSCGICVEFDKNIGGHDGERGGTPLGKKGHCWWVSPIDLTLQSTVTKAVFSWRKKATNISEFMLKLAARGY